MIARDDMDFFHTVNPAFFRTVSGKTAEPLFRAILPYEAGAGKKKVRVDGGEKETKRKSRKKDGRKERKGLANRGKPCTIEEKDGPGPVMNTEVRVWRTK